MLLDFAQILFLLCSVMFFIGLKATFDLNIHQIQYVSDHVSEKQCRQLVALLEVKTINLPQARVDDTKLPNVSCISLLLLWDRTAGTKKSFHQISIRLYQMGLQNVANSLAASVYGENANQVQTALFDKPYEKSVRKGSQILARAPEPVKDHRLDEEPSAWSGAQLTGLLLGIIAIIIVICAVARDQGPCRKFRNLTNEHLLGKKPPEQHVVGDLQPLIPPNEVIFLDYPAPTSKDDVHPAKKFIQLVSKL